LTIPSGAFFGIIGRSGAGKSTLLRMTNRLIDPSEGRILFDGTDITRLRGRALRDWRANCGMIFHHARQEVLFCCGSRWRRWKRYP
jgi:phosphonate transport system ATP-binding protein